jgi:hypothetical protein
MKLTDVLVQLAAEGIQCELAALVLAFTRPMEPVGALHGPPMGVDVGGTATAAAAAAGHGQLLSPDGAIASYELEDINVKTTMDLIDELDAEAALERQTERSAQASSAEAAATGIAAQREDDDGETAPDSSSAIPKRGCRD